MPAGQISPDRRIVVEKFQQAQDMSVQRTGLDLPDKGPDPGPGRQLAGFSVEPISLPAAVRRRTAELSGHDDRIQRVAIEPQGQPGFVDRAADSKKSTGRQRWRLGDQFRHVGTRYRNQEIGHKCPMSGVPPTKPWFWSWSVQDPSCRPTLLTDWLLAEPSADHQVTIAYRASQTKKFLDLQPHSF